MLLPLVLMLALALPLRAAQVDGATARDVAATFVAGRSAGMARLAGEAPLLERTGRLRVFRVEPAGYVVVSGDDALPPVPAFSFQAEFGPPDPAANPLLDWLLADQEARLAHPEHLSELLRSNRAQEWRSLSAGQVRDHGRMQIWPEPGTTTTGGWVETRWGQGPPWNNDCPLDGGSGSRSVAGCPAVVMAQILNLHQSTQGTRFGRGDRYRHNYGGNQYWIDDDWQEFGFPSFPALNTALDSLDAHWASGATPADGDMAALVFACGVAARQVYHPQGSGTFGVGQALDAWHRFGYSGARLLEDGDSLVWESVAQDMMEGHPAHLAVVTPAWDAGHNVVVDGYDSDGYFHVNFGWNGTHDGWYLLPAELPYNLTALEGVVVDLVPPAATVAPSRPRSAGIRLSAWPNPANPSTRLELSLEEAGPVELAVYNLAGQQVARVWQGALPAGRSTFQWRPAGASGLYVAVARDASGGRTATRILVVK